eukprot:1178821-Prorocentrum_minimum.AAC.2
MCRRPPRALPSLESRRRCTLPGSPARGGSNIDCHSSHLLGAPVNNLEPSAVVGGRPAGTFITPTAPALRILTIDARSSGTVWVTVPTSAPLSLPSIESRKCKALLVMSISTCVQCTPWWMGTKTLSHARTSYPSTLVPVHRFTASSETAAVLPVGKRSTHQTGVILPPFYDVSYRNDAPDFMVTFHVSLTWIEAQLPLLQQSHGEVNHLIIEPF